MTDLLPNKPAILIVDDEPDSQRYLIPVLSPTATPQVVHPSEVTAEDLESADLVLVDFVLNDWKERDQISSLALRPSNGLALAAVLRAHATAASNRPRAFAIHSAHLKELNAGLPPETREHAIARAHNLEWVFPKVQDPTAPAHAQQFLELASAMRKLPTAWPNDGSGSHVDSIARELLAIPDTNWFERAWAEIEACHPPLHELSEATNGLAFARWLLHRILPYPCFLWDLPHLAARLQASQSSLRSILSRHSRLASALGEVQFKGTLGEFLGPRWWRSGVEMLLWELTQGNPFEPEIFHKTLTEAASDVIEFTSSSHAVPCLDRNFRPLPQPVEIEYAVRIQPDDWPPYADQAWTSIELAREELSLRVLVVEEDRERLK